MLVPLLLEGWTFYNLIKNSITGTAGGGAGTGSVQSEHLYGKGDEILPGTPATERILGMSIINRENRWSFEMTIRVNNPSPDPYVIELVEVVLQDGTRLKRSARNRVGAGQTGTFGASVDLPTGTIPKMIKLRLSGSPGSESRTTEIPLSSVPVRKQAP
jgi:hypothetical protein